MQTYMMLTRLAPSSLETPISLEHLERKLMAQVRKRCPTVEWIQSYALLGPYDYVDLFQAPDLETATRVATLVRTIGHARVDVWPLVAWNDYKKLLEQLPAAAG